MHRHESRTFLAGVNVPSTSNKAIISVLFADIVAGHHSLTHDSQSKQVAYEASRVEQPQSWEMLL